MKDSYVFYKDKLGGEYASAFEKIEMYVLTQNFDEAAREERLSELLDIFLAAKDEGRPIERITGGDIPRFCRTFCSDLGMKNRLLAAVDYIYRIAFWLLIFSAVDILFLLIGRDTRTIAEVWSSYSGINISGLIIGAAVSGIVAAASGVLIRRAMFRAKKISMGALKAAQYTVAASTFLILLSAMLMTETELFTVPSWIIIALTAPIVILYYVFRGRHIKRDRVSMSALVSENLAVTAAGTMERKYAKKKKRREKRGGSYDMKEFLEKEEADCVWTERSLWLYLIIPPAITVFDAVNRLGTSSPKDIIILSAITLTVEYAVMMWLRKAAVEGIRARRAWIAQKREELAAADGREDEDGEDIEDM